VVERPDGRLWMLSRCMAEAASAFSADGGRSWTEQSTAFPHCNSRCGLRRLASGAILLVEPAAGRGAIQCRNLKFTGLTQNLGQL
jgi:hypothetical protein